MSGLVAMLHGLRGTGVQALLLLELGPLQVNLVLHAHLPPNCPQVHDSTPAWHLNSYCDH